MTFRSSTADRLPAELADWVAEQPGRPWLRLAVDAPVAEQGRDLATALVEELLRRGRPALRVAASGFLRPASLRLEHGREDVEAYPDWLDRGALRREVLEPAGATGTGRVLPSRWDAVADRATRADYVELRPGAVLVVDGMFLLDGTLDFDLGIHLAVSAQAAARLLPPDLHWTLPAHRDYVATARPDQTADLTVRMDHPDRPAYRLRAG
ncbi:MULTISPECIES: hypothetical protein [Actinoalloteichus]|uniref:Uridine kinase n=1 Tax=Actinoalloteichus fjordicus TaxID=1612552 RepID=A0AAC9LAV5_9PSEU|nr:MULTISPECIES: hypothetical protein [Actinoalloteichus]APU14398.1 hypothetical protein UA74_11690 [Actinoalloteichus fjordicus]APU20367.1 hypothetical protein UA75_11775 [Actinoalloteichus sp. GBA129-24]